MSNKLSDTDIAELIKHYACAPFLGTDAGALVYRLARTVEEERRELAKVEAERQSLLDAMEGEFDSANVQRQRDALAAAAGAVYRTLAGVDGFASDKDGDCRWCTASMERHDEMPAAQCPLAALRTALRAAGVNVDE